MTNAVVQVPVAPEWHPEVAKNRRRVFIPATTDDFQIVTFAGTLLQFVMEETTGTAGARFVLYDGQSDTAESLGPWTLSAGESFDNAYPPHGIPFQSGLYLKVTSGSVSGVAHFGTLVPWPLHDEGLH